MSKTHKIVVKGSNRITYFGTKEECEKLCVIWNQKNLPEHVVKEVEDCDLRSERADSTWAISLCYSR